MALRGQAGIDDDGPGYASASDGLVPVGKRPRLKWLFESTDDALDHPLWARSALLNTRTDTAAYAGFSYADTESIGRSMSFGVFQVEGKYRRVVNLRVAAAEGVCFSRSMLKLARVLR